MSRTKVKKLVRLPEVMNRTGLSRSMVYQLMAREEFPRQVKLSLRMAGWVESEIDHWIERRIALRDMG